MKYRRQCNYRTYWKLLDEVTNSSSSQQPWEWVPSITSRLLGPKKMKSQTQDQAVDICLRQEY